MSRVLLNAQVWQSPEKSTNSDYVGSSVDIICRLSGQGQLRSLLLTGCQQQRDRASGDLRLRRLTLSKVWEWKIPKSPWKNDFGPFTCTLQLNHSRCPTLWKN